MVSYNLTSVLRTPIRLLTQKTKFVHCDTATATVFPSNGTLTPYSEVSRHKLFGFKFCGSNHSLRVLNFPPHSPAHPTHTLPWPLCFLLLRCEDSMHDKGAPCDHAIRLATPRFLCHKYTNNWLFGPHKKTRRYHSHLIKTCHMKYAGFHCSRHNMYWFQWVNKLILRQVPTALQCLSIS